MPGPIKRFCRKPGCPEIVTTSYCDKHRPKRRGPDNRPPSSQRGYDARWRRFRSWWLSQNPLCCECEKQGIVTAAKDVDHIIPVNQGGGMYDTANVQSLCHSHHSIKTNREDGGYGNPVMPIANPGDSK